MKRKFPKTAIIRSEIPNLFSTRVFDCLKTLKKKSLKVFKKGIVFIKHYWFEILFAAISTGILSLLSLLIFLSPLFLT